VFVKVSVAFAEVVVVVTSVTVLAFGVVVVAGKTTSVALNVMVEMAEGLVFCAWVAGEVVLVSVAGEVVLVPVAGEVVAGDVVFVPMAGDVVLFCANTNGTKPIKKMLEKMSCTLMACSVRCYGRSPCAFCSW